MTITLTPEEQRQIAAAVRESVNTIRIEIAEWAALANRTDEAKVLGSIFHDPTIKLVKKRSTDLVKPK